MRYFQKLEKNNKNKKSWKDRLYSLSFHFLKRKVEIFFVFLVTFFKILGTKYA